MMPFHWLAEHVAAISADTMPMAAPLARGAVAAVLPGHDVWDYWPLLTTDGALAVIGGGLVMFALAAPAGVDPNDRHAIAGIRAFHATAVGWDDLGWVLPHGSTPGSRQWSGSAILAEDGAVRLFFTAVGQRGEAAPSVDQRLFEASATLVVTGGLPRLVDWQPALECARPDGVHYATDMAGGGAIGTIKAFRDPYFLRIKGDDWLLFTGSDARSVSPWNGVIGAARRESDHWALVPPLVIASELNNELERPHAIVRNGAVYLFWSTQQSVFAADGPRGPTGLYGVMAAEWGASWQPINGTGLVFANPSSAPYQAYSFQVLPEGSVRSFADMPQVAVPPSDAAGRRAAFVGGPAPVLNLAFDGPCVTLVTK